MLLVHCQKLYHLDEILEKKRASELAIRAELKALLPPKIAKFVVPTLEVKQVLLNPVKFINNLEDEYKDFRETNKGVEEEDSLEYLFRAILGQRLSYSCRRTIDL